MLNLYQKLKGKWLMLIDTVIFSYLAHKFVIVFLRLFLSILIHFNTITFNPKQEFM